MAPNTNYQITESLFNNSTYRNLNIDNLFNVKKMDLFQGSDILKLAELLQQGQPEDDFEDDQKVRTSSKKATPADIAKPKVVRQPEPEESNDDPDDYEKKFESQLQSDAQVHDWRKTPHWNLLYKQAVTPSDVFLQMSGKTQLTSSCEEMVIEIELPGEKAPNIDVKLKRDYLDLLSPQFRLSIPLPHTVDPQKGSAKWDSQKEALVLTLVMDREFDYVNF